MTNENNAVSPIADCHDRALINVCRTKHDPAFSWVLAHLSQSISVMLHAVLLAAKSPQCNKLAKTTGLLYVNT